MLPTHRGPAGVKVWAGTSDTFHPNDAGHRVIADMILDRIRFS
jgi:lysophospholipase L1-like esterase